MASPSSGRKQVWTPSVDGGWEVLKEHVRLEIIPVANFQKYDQPQIMMQLGSSMHSLTPHAQHEVICDKSSCPLSLAFCVPLFEPWYFRTSLNCAALWVLVFGVFPFFTDFMTSLTHNTPGSVKQPWEGSDCKHLVLLSVWKLEASYLLFFLQCRQMSVVPECLFTKQ